MGTPTTPAEALHAAWSPPATVAFLADADGVLHAKAISSSHGSLPYPLTEVLIPADQAIHTTLCSLCPHAEVDEIRQHQAVLRHALSVVSVRHTPSWADVSYWHQSAIDPFSGMTGILSSKPAPPSRAVAAVLARACRALADEHAQALPLEELLLAVAIPAVSFPITPAQAGSLKAFATAALELRGYPHGSAVWLDHARAELAAAPVVPGVLAAPAIERQEAALVELLCFAHGAPPAFAYLHLPSVVWSGISALGAHVARVSLEHFEPAVRSRVLDIAAKLWDPSPDALLNDVDTVLTIAAESFS
jgi:hypothetical protein